MNLLIVGSVATDTIETPHGQVDRALGGSAVYASVAASYFARPGIVGVVGGDFARRHLSLLARRGVDLTGLQIEPEAKTFHWSGWYEGDMNQANTRSTELNVFESFDPIIPSVYRKAPFVLLGNIHPALQLKVLAQVDSPKLVLCDTMNFWIESAPDLLRKVFRKVDVICINDGEAAQFCHTTSTVHAAQKLLALGPQWVIIKKGAHGVQLHSRDSFFSLPALPLKRVVDPTGAGDSFAGGVMGWLARSGKLNDPTFRRALVAGTVLASYCVQNFSCRGTTGLSSNEINARADQLAAACRVPSFHLS